MRVAVLSSSIVVHCHYCIDSVAFARCSAVFLVLWLQIPTYSACQRWRYVIYWFVSRNSACFHRFVSEAYPIVCYALQNDSSGTTRLLRIKVIEGVNLAKKDIFGARYEVFQNVARPLYPKSV